MSYRALHLVSILLLLTIAACSRKPADTGSGSPSQNAAAPPNASVPSNATGGNEMSSSAPVPASPAPAATTPAPSVTPAEAPPPVVVPAGTDLSVKLKDSLGSKLNSPGDSFRATLASDLRVNGDTVISAGAAIRGRVIDAKALGKLKGAALLEIKLTSITVNGTDQPISSSTITRTLKGKGKRTAVVAGGGTAFGAIVGGLAGGGKGAAIGAVAGGGAGTAGAAYTGNDEIVLPIGAALSFKLKSPLTVNPPTVNPVPANPTQ
jgi:hypothetical protein